MGVYHCSNCNADLSFQSGFLPNLSYWTCKACGQNVSLLQNDSSSVNKKCFCDYCGSELTAQPNFNPSNGSWVCTECRNTNSLPDFIMPVDLNKTTFKNSQGTFNNGVIYGNQIPYGDQNIFNQVQYGNQNNYGQHYSQQYNNVPYPSQTNMNVPYNNPVNTPYYGNTGGMPVFNPNQYQLGTPKNKYVALVLCIWLGFFGAHKFYEGKSST